MGVPARQRPKTYQQGNKEVGQEKTTIKRQSISLKVKKQIQQGSISIFLTVHFGKKLKKILTVILATSPAESPVL